MIYGNQESQKALRTVMQSLDKNHGGRSVFLIVSGPDGVGKTSFIQEVSKEVLGAYYMQDFLFVPNLTKLIGKKHQIKIGTTGSLPDTIELTDGQVYNDIGMRDITYRLQKSSASGKKILLLENIERMNNAAANAFLKAAEEPLPGTIIIATVTHKSQVMETILSRAITIPFQALTTQEMEQYCQTSGQNFINAQAKDLLLRMAMGRPGMLTELLHNNDEDIQSIFVQAIAAMKGNSIHTQYSTLTKLNKLGYLHIFLDARIAELSQKNSKKTQYRLRVKKQLQTNVSIDRLLLHGIIS